MRLRITAAVGALALAAAVTTPARPALADGTRDGQWYLNTLHVSEAQAITKGAGVTVAVVDSGTSPHPDLRQNLLAGITVVAGESGNGQKDADGHGTNMAAVIAAHGRDGSGVLGIAPDAKLLPVRVFKTPATGDGNDIAKGIAWAAANRAKVISVSVGGGPSFTMEDAVSAALKADSIVVAAVGNEPNIIDFPAASDGVLTVGGTGRDGKHASFSIKDPRIQICAPGDKIRTASPSKYVDSTGTSPAAAIVSGAAALVRAKFPQLSGPEVVHRLTATADDIGPPGRDDECGFGVLNIVKALTANVPPLEGSAATAPASSAVASTDSGYIDPAAATTPAPQAEAEPASSSTPLVLGGVLVGLVVAGGLAAALVIRRRRSF